MKAVALGCGEMGRVAIQDLYLRSGFEEILVCVRNPEKAKSLLRWHERTNGRIRFRSIDIGQCEKLPELFSECDVVVNCAGPNYKYEIPVARAAIEAKVNLVDLNDDYATTIAMYDLDQQAKEAGVTIIMGLGASPGVNNILVRAAASELDEVEEIHTAWIMSAADPGGLALSCHLLYSLSDRAFTVNEGKTIEVQSFVDGKECLEFPKPIGPMDVCHIGHPEPITLSRRYRNARCIDNKASFNPPFVNDLIVRLGGMVRAAKGPIQTAEGPVDAMDFAAANLLKACRSVKDIPRDGALRVEVKGRKNGRGLRIIYTGTGRITSGTGIPVSIGAAMLAKGMIDQKGVLAPEDCIDPYDFLEEILSRGVGELEEERIAC